MINWIRKILERFRRKGTLATLQYALIRIEEVTFDWRYGVRTGRTVLNSTCADQDGHGYWPALATEARKILQHLDNKTNQDVFMDFGSGLGRVVILAARYPFKRVVGIERNHALHQIAQENIGRIQKQARCGKIELLLGDAGHYMIPSDVNILYFNEPFETELLKQVLSNLYESLRLHPREITLVYRFPRTFDIVFPSVPWLEKTGDFRVLFKHVICKARLEMIAGEPARAQGG